MKTFKSYVVVLAISLIPCGVLAQQESTIVETVKTTETGGTIRELNPDTIVIRTENGSPQANYTYSERTTYVDETGTPVSVETVKVGQPVTVYYTREGDHLVADKVVVRKTTTTTTTGGPIIHQEKRTDTTTTTTTGPN